MQRDVHRATGAHRPLDLALPAILVAAVPRSSAGPSGARTVGETIEKRGLHFEAMLSLIWLGRCINKRSPRHRIASWTAWPSDVSRSSGICFLHAPDRDETN